MNVLLTCAGRRNYLVKYFREALQGAGKVYAADASEYAPALQEADEGFVVPLVGDDLYFDVIEDICIRNDIELIIPLNDLELPLLARQRERFLRIGAIPVVSSPEVVDMCFDKLETARFLKENGIDTPTTFACIRDVEQALSNNEIGFPLVVKPRWGTASIGVFYVYNVEELRVAYRWLQMFLERSMLASISGKDRNRCVIIQEKLDGIEYGLDIINDLDGAYVATLAKRKLSMRAGETDRAITVKDNELELIGSQISRTLSHVGNLDCDVYVTNNGYYVLEMNPRFGGGYPFSHVAGANLPAALLAWARGESVDTSLFAVRPNVCAAKFDDIVVCDSVHKWEA